MIRPRRAALAKSVQRFSEMHAFGFDPRDHAQSRLSSAMVIQLDLIAPIRGCDRKSLIWRMSMENPLWAAPCVHGQLLKLGFEAAQSSVPKYMVKRRGPPDPRLIASRICPDLISDRRKYRSVNRTTKYSAPKSVASEPSKQSVTNKPIVPVSSDAEGCAVGCA
jgi:hypothetical protein